MIFTASWFNFIYIARSKYGNNEITYPIFSKKEIDSFKGLILRNCGNDFQYSFIRDAMIQAVVTPHMDVDGQAYEPVQVHMNGEYWGIHNLREKVNEHWVTSNYGIPDENLDFIKNRNEVFAGSYDGYHSLMMYLENNSLAPDDNYEVVASQIDIDSFYYRLSDIFPAHIERWNRPNSIEDWNFEVDQLRLLPKLSNGTLTCTSTNSWLQTREHCLMNSEKMMIG